MNTNIQNLVDNHQDKHALQREFYCEPEIFILEQEKVLRDLWHMAGHVSRIPDSGDYFIFRIDKEEIIIVRDQNNEIHAHYNVCRHRGSRICKDDVGHKSALVCPYHAWTYNLDGSLRKARLMGKDFQSEKYGLHQCQVRVTSGIIFISLADKPDNFDDEMNHYHEHLNFHGIKDAKIARRLELPTRANWKLVVENFIECYHCIPSHPEYCSVHSELKLLAAGAGLGSGPEKENREFQLEFDRWNKKVASFGHPGSSEYVSRMPIKEGFLTESQDGQAVAPLMGKFKKYDGGVTYIAFNYLNYLMASNDHAVILRFTPKTELETDVEVTWLVDGNAKEGVDYDPARVSWVWDVTLAQDAIITEDNQAGVMSSQFVPGPYSDQEQINKLFIQWYLGRLN